MRAVAIERGEPIDELLRRLYYDEGRTLFEIGEELGINHSTVWHWLRRCGIAAKQLQPPAPAGAVA
jgi:DNA-directed RNA polymerase specialized sigma subunit